MSIMNSDISSGPIFFIPSIGSVLARRRSNVYSELCNQMYISAYECNIILIIGVFKKLVCVFSLTGDERFDLTSTLNSHIRMFSYQNSYETITIAEFNDRFFSMSRHTKKAIILFCYGNI